MGRAAKLKAARKEMRKDPEVEKFVRKESKRRVNYGMNYTLEDFVDKNVYLILHALVKKFDFGAGRLERFMDGYAEAVQDLRDFLDEDIDGENVKFTAKEVVEAKGFSLEEWKKKHGPLS